MYFSHDTKYASTANNDIFRVHNKDARAGRGVN